MNASESRNAAKGPVGIGGWLLFLIIGMTVLGPLMAIGGTGAAFSSAEQQYPNIVNLSSWSSYKTVTWIVQLIVCVISIWGGYGLATQRNPEVVSRAKTVIWINYAGAMIVIGMIIPAIMLPNGGSIAAESLPKLIAALIPACIWTTYLGRSKRVRNTYFSASNSGARTSDLSSPYSASRAMATDTEDSANSSGTTRATPAESKSPVIDNLTTNAASALPREPTIVDEDAIYAAIATELRNGATNEGLWTRLFAECDGDENKTKAAYIKQRAEKLKAVEQARIGEITRLRDEEAARLERIRLDSKLTEEQRAYELAPKGQCPDCDAVILMASEVCSKCGAIFTHPEGWKVLPINNA